MSAGPIAQARRAHVAPKTSTAAKDRVCADGTALHGTASRAYCGRTSGKRATTWSEVTCTDCAAARRADLAANERTNA